MPAVRRCATAAAALAALVLAACGGGGAGEGGGGSAAAGPQVALTLQRVFARLPAFSAPVALLQAPNDASRWFVVQQDGRVLVFPNDPMAAATAVFVDISGRVAFRGEAGLLGMAFHPRFPADRRVVLFYSRDEPGVGLVSRLSEFSADAAGLGLDPVSERVLVTIRKPEENHNGGGIAFGPDGFLYAGIGDGGGGNDQHGAIGNAQSATTLLGKMLRIDVADGTGGYLIPPGNPFRGNPLCAASGSGAQACPEIFALGLRNPWRWSFDRLTGQLWVGDVGQNALEEVNRVELGGNYGWRCFEGTRGTGLECGSPPRTLAPVAEYGRGAGSSVTGGHVYRGAAFPALAGRYVFGDFVSGRIFNIDAAAQPTLAMSAGFASGLNISTFAEDADGELYVVHYGGELYRIVP
jgi:glucose/arabinose dehydrogenase